jgi:hypothetical protein
MIRINFIIIFRRIWTALHCRRSIACCYDGMIYCMMYLLLTELRLQLTAYSTGVQGNMYTVYRM